ncbi:WecB/TagA/CpsF family glycosyltransferase [Lyngbya aestuarii]|uniref:WecB/TagA/CpsF family glycosyltransferase n=1 Tax=Lyngbya aestuarii TaxID=118322 RepID=UPI00403E27D0
MDKVKILNLSIDNLSQAELLRDLKIGIIFTPNVDHLVKLQKDKDFFSAYQSADYKLCDSQLIIFISRFLGSPIKERVAGSDFFPAFYDYHKKNEVIKIFLLGAAEGVAAKAQERINAKVNREIVVGTYSPPFGFEKDEQECLKIFEEVNKSDATVLAVGLGAPKQEIFISKYKNRFPNIKIFMGIGATIDFEAGKFTKPPKLIADLGLEWLWRLLSDPKRLWKRYLVEDMTFFGMVLKQKLKLYVEPFRDN